MGGVLWREREDFPRRDAENAEKNAEKTWRRGDGSWCGSGGFGRGIFARATVAGRSVP
jgi:hypothetical protein